MTRLKSIAGRRGWPMRAVGILLVGLMASSCSKAALMAPTSSTLTIMVSRTSIGLESTVTITAIVAESSGTPVHDGTVVQFYSTLGTLSASQATTTNGQAIVQLLTGAQSGTAEISASSGAAKLAAAVKITVGAAAVGRVDLSASPSALSSQGGTSTITATVTDASGNRLAGIPVTFTTTAGVIEQPGSPTDANGQTQARLTTQLLASVGASVAGGTSGTVSATAVAVTIRSAPTAAFGTVTQSGFIATILYSAIAASGGAAISSATINFGDGTSQGPLAVGASQSVVHLYPTLGTFTAQLTVVDAAGETATATLAIVVK